MRQKGAIGEYKREDVMRRDKLIGTALCAGVLALCGGHALAGEDFSARLVGFNETPLAILSDATGTLHLDLNDKAKTITYTLTYTGPFTSDVQQAHIHFGKVHVSGGIIVWLCQTAAKPSPVATTPQCKTPSPSATVTGTIMASDVLPLSGQNVTAKDFDAIEDALNSNTAYTNIHTLNFPSGEIRGQIHKGDLDDKHDDHEHK
jgi:hypothetical protein